MTDCWARDPETRPDFDKIIELLVENPPPSTYNRLNIKTDAMEKTLTVDEKPLNDSNQTTGRSNG